MPFVLLMYCSSISWGNVSVAKAQDLSRKNELIKNLEASATYSIKAPFGFFFFSSLKHGWTVIYFIGIYLFLRVTTRLLPQNSIFLFHFCSGCNVFSAVDVMLWETDLQRYAMSLILCKVYLLNLLVSFVHLPYALLYSW